MQQLPLAPTRLEKSVVSCLTKSLVSFMGGEKIFQSNHDSPQLFSKATEPGRTWVSKFLPGYGSRKILMIIACRKVRRNIVLPDDTIILGRDQLLALYGPNLNCRPQFLIQKFDEESGYIAKDDDE